MRFVGNHLGGSLHVGHYHCYIRKELEDSDIFYKAEDDKKIETVSDKDMKHHLPSAYTFVYLKQQPTVKEDKNIVTVEDTVEDTLSEEEMGKPIVVSDDEQGSEKASEEPSDNVKVIDPDCVQSCDDIPKGPSNSAENIVEDSSDEVNFSDGSDKDNIIGSNSDRLSDHSGDDSNESVEIVVKDSAEIETDHIEGYCEEVPAFWFKKGFN